ncbi:MAG: aminopeptidase P family protein [Bacteroidota bacterium]
MDKKLSALRKLMKKSNIQAYIIPSTDPHMSEYVADFWESRKWISGFTGSAGLVVVTMTESGLWTDGRYFLQAEQQLEGSEMKLFKQGMPDVPEFDEWLTKTLSKGEVVGVDSRVFAVSAYAKLRNTLKKVGLKLDGNNDFIKTIWEDRPEMPAEKAYILDEKYAGKSISDKISEIRKKYTELEADSHLVATLDDIAWIFNLRGSDVAYNPVTIAYALFTKDNTTLFIKKKKLSEQAKAVLKDNGVQVKSYKALESYVKNNLTYSKCLVDPDRLNQKVLSWIKKGSEIIKATNPSTFFKSAKNKTELENIRNAMRKDGIAMTKFLHWIDNSVAGGEVTEVGISDKLIELRKEQENFVGESFPTIAGYREHGAIIHYSANGESDKKLEASSFVLVDSGAQYLDGTTDLTRTIALGPLTEEEKRDYTLVLKGHIQLALAKFPEGTRGCQLDTLARQALLREGKNYHHGTGHGVGFFLNVHEGPHSIRPDLNQNPILESSITSNEPGLYRAGKHGIRIETLVAANKWKETEFGNFFEFETLTLCPMDTRPIVNELLLDEEKEWLNNYHKEVYEKISPSVEGDVLEWLKAATKAI